LGRVIFLISEARSKAQMKSAFFDKLNSRIVMGEYRSAKLIIVVEGIIDGEVFGKIRIPGGPVDVETIESLIKDTIGQKESIVETKERRLVGSAKNLVSEVTQRLNENGFNAIGIQDEDLVSVTRFIRGHKFESSSRQTIFTTFPSTDMENILYPVLSNQNKLSGLNIEKGMPNCKSLAMSRIGLKIYQKKERNKLRQHNGKESDNIPRLKNLFPKWDQKDRAKSFISQRKFVENTGNIESIIGLIISQNVFSDPDLLTSYVECCKLALQKTEQSELEWFNFVRGHDLEWFIRFHNEIGTKRLREILLSGINFDILSDHQLFQSVEEWRKNNHLPRLFVSSKTEEE